MSGADLALVNGRLLTLDPRRPRVEAALARCGRIVLVGSTQAVFEARGDAPVFDCGGRTVIPGFIGGEVVWTRSLSDTGE